MKPLRIHFACLFGVDFETDILPYWLKHYVAMKFDSYKVFLHRENGRIADTLIGTFKNAGFAVECLTGLPHSNGLLRMNAMESHAQTLPGDDYLVTADADEFHLIDYWKELQEYDMVSGYLLDHYGDHLEACCKDPFVQYPHKEPFTRELLKNFTPPFLRTTEWPFTRRTKILAARADDEVHYAGSHSMKAVRLNANILEDVEVHHFAWRESARRKLAVKTYFNRENLDEMYIDPLLGTNGTPPEQSAKFDRLKILDTIEVL